MNADNFSVPQCCVIVLITLSVFLHGWLLYATLLPMYLFTTASIVLVRRHTRRNVCDAAATSGHYQIEGEDA